MEFYSVSAQIIVVLLLALTIESTVLQKVEPRVWDKSRHFFLFNDILIYIWAVSGLMLCMLKIADFRLITGQDGRLFTLSSVLLLLTHLLVNIILKHDYKSTTRNFVAGICFIAYVTLPSALLGIIPYWKYGNLDMIFAGSVPLLSILFACIFLCKNKKKHAFELIKLLGIGSTTAR